MTWRNGTTVIVYYLLLSYIDLGVAILYSVAQTINIGGLLVSMLYGILKTVQKRVSPAHTYGVMFLLGRVNQSFHHRFSRANQKVVMIEC